MTCETAFTISDGATLVTVSIGSIAGSYSIGKELMREGVAPFRGADGTGALDVRFQKFRYTISGAGPANPTLFSLDLTAASWTVTIPGFADGSAEEIWIVVPAYPAQTKDRLGGAHSWTLTLEDA
jgi:hypothetical protein